MLEDNDPVPQKLPEKPQEVSQPAKTAQKLLSKVSRRKALISALLAGAVLGAPKAKAATNACECLPAPDCNAVCPNGGTPKGDGTQACECIEIPTNMPPRALALVDGGDAVNALKLNGHELRKQYNSSATMIPVISGNYIDYINKSDIAGTLPVIGAKVLYNNGVLSETPAANWRYDVPQHYVAVKRDSYGRVEAVGTHKYWVQCDCRCNCDCSDDSGCFIQVRLMTTEGPKAVEKLVAGDKLVGLDGIHKIVDIAQNTLGNRRAVSPKGYPDVLLTQEHIFISGNSPVVYSESDYWLNKKVLRGVNGWEGVYAQEFLDDQCRIRPEAFDVLDLSSDTKTYTPIVSSGHWGMTEEGVPVLLCQVITK